MKKHVLFLFTLFVSASMAFGQLAITSPYTAGHNGFQWGKTDWQRGAEVIFQGHYNIIDYVADSTSINISHLNGSWGAVTTGVSNAIQFCDGVNGQPVDSIINDTLTIPADFNLTADYPADNKFFFQARAYFTPTYDSYSNGMVNIIEAYADSVAIDTVYNTVGWKTNLGEVNLGDTISLKGRYGIDGISKVEVLLMHMNSSWGFVKNDVAVYVYDAANNIGVKSGHFDTEYIISNDFNTVSDLAVGDFFALRVMTEYASGTKKFAFLFLDVVQKNVTGVTLDMATLNLAVGASQLLTATVAPETAEDKSIVWSSSDDGIAFVEQSGLVSGIANGTATITVTTTDGDFTATCDVTVGPSDIGLNETSGVSVYPNPATDLLNIEGLNRGQYQVSVYSMLGSRIRSYEIDGAGFNSLSIEELPNGIYILDIQGDVERSIHRISKR